MNCWYQLYTLWIQLSIIAISMIFTYSTNSANQIAMIRSVITTTSIILSFWLNFLAHFGKFYMYMINFERCNHIVK